MTEFQVNIHKMKTDIETVRIKKRQRLKDLDFIVIDNSIRESTVGQLRSHTLENKKAIHLNSHFLTCL